MRFANKFRLSAVGLILASWMSACGSGNSGAAPADIRVVNLDGTNGVTLYLNSTAYTFSAAAGAASGYGQVVAGVYQGSVVSASANIASDAFPGLGLGSSQYYSVLSYPRAGVLYAYQLVDNVLAPAAGQAELAVANASPDAGPVDAYLFVHNSSSPADPCANTLAGPVFTSVQGQQSSPEPLAVTDSTGKQILYDICVTAASTPTDTRFSAAQVQLASTSATTLALTSGSGGTLVNGALVVQNGGVTLLPNPNFRVRVLGAQGSANPAAVVTVNGTVLPNVYSGNTSGYVTVPVSSAAPVVSGVVGGNSFGVSLPAGFTNFAAGADYTIVVYGTTTQGAVLLTDDNHFLLAKASVRLVNAADSGSGLTMYVNGQVEASNTLLGTASAYYGVDTGTDTLDLRSSDLTVGTGAAAPQNFNFVTGGVYTVFLYDVTQPPAIFRDRGS